MHTQNTPEHDDDTTTLKNTLIFSYFYYIIFIYNLLHNRNIRLIYVVKRSKIQRKKKKCLITPDLNEINKFRFL